MMNLMIGRLWLCWCNDNESRSGGVGYDSDTEKASLVWTKIGPLQIMWFINYQKGPWICSLRKAS